MTQTPVLLLTCYLIHAAILILCRCNGSHQALDTDVLIDSFASSDTYAPSGSLPSIVTCICIDSHFTHDTYDLSGSSILIDTGWYIDSHSKHDTLHVMWFTAPMILTIFLIRSLCLVLIDTLIHAEFLLPAMFLVHSCSMILTVSLIRSDYLPSVLLRWFTHVL